MPCDPRLFGSAGAVWLNACETGFLAHCARSKIGSGWPKSGSCGEVDTTVTQHSSPRVRSALWPPDAVSEALPNDRQVGQTQYGVAATFSQARDSAAPRIRSRSEGRLASTCTTHLCLSVATALKLDVVNMGHVGRNGARPRRRHCLAKSGVRRKVTSPFAIRPQVDHLQMWFKEHFSHICLTRCGYRQSRSAWEDFSA